jgi:hypothetical protein
MEQKKMKTALKIAAGLSAVSALTGLASTAYAQSSAAATATGTATIIQSISISATSQLGFGTIVKPSSGTTTIIVSNAGARSFSGANPTFPNANGVSAASFLIQGEGGATLNISVPATFNMTSGTSNTLVVTTTNTGTAGPLSGGIGTQGSFVVGVGGSFPLTTNQASGAYSGNLIVSANYN